MYLPYLRGKQFELVAIRELSALLGRNSAKISPIIEPVKDSSTFKSTIRELILKRVNFTVIVNPQAGNFRNPSDILNALQPITAGYQDFQIGIILNGKINLTGVLALLRNRLAEIPALTLIHEASYDNIQDIIQDIEQDFTVKFNVINLGKASRRYPRNFDPATVVELDDYFSVQPKNSDYLTVDNSAFSEEHLYYATEGFIGFSDFLTVGDNYSDTGFLPYAVAIHISYATASNAIRVKHFVSDSNDDTSDIGGKFDEALVKLIAWCDATGHNTSAIQVFRELHANGHFPGLGTLKKLAIINHIELILRLI